jgi:hypothetical protein
VHRKVQTKEQVQMLNGLSRKTLRAWYAANKEFAESVIFGLNLKAGYGHRESYQRSRRQRAQSAQLVD